jgi:hypothetical protein
MARRRRRTEPGGWPPPAVRINGQPNVAGSLSNMALQMAAHMTLARFRAGRRTGWRPIPRIWLPARIGLVVSVAGIGSVRRVPARLRGITFPRQLGLSAGRPKREKSSGPLIPEARAAGASGSSVPPSGAGCASGSSVDSSATRKLVMSVILAPSSVSTFMTAGMYWRVAWWSR